MIIPVKLDSFHSSFIVCLDEMIEQNDFLERSRVVRDSYAGELLSALHDLLFHRSLELTADFVNYYQIEYDLFKDYLRKRLLIPRSVVEKLTPELERCRLMFLFAAPYYFLEEDYGVDLLQRLLEPERQNEN